MNSPSRKRIAVIGSGVAGLTAAHLLDSHHDVVLFEKSNRLGGHTNTIVLPDGPDRGVSIDTGFIVYNQKNYPLFCRLMNKLGVETAPSDMAFGLSCAETGLEYCSDFPSGLFAQRRNAINPQFLKFIRDIFRFNKIAKKDLGSDRVRLQALGDWLKSHKAGRMFLDFYLLPMGSAIWSMSAAEMLDFPAEMFLRFFENHGLWDLKNRPRWRFVMGGGQIYIQKIKNAFRGKIQMEAGVSQVRRIGGATEVVTKKGVEEFDAVVIAAHADEAFSMIQNPTEAEKKHLSIWKYTRNEAVLHWDDTLMPKRRVAWASWNLLRLASTKPAKVVSLTYWMNRLQNLKTTRPYFVTLNATELIDPNKVIQKIQYTHPHYSFDSLDSQRNLPLLNGAENIYFCGSYFGYGFHEDAVRSAAQVATLLGGDRLDDSV